MSLSKNLIVATGKPAHLAQLDGDQWELWREVGLRSAGFPIEHLSALANPSSAAAADNILITDGQMREVRARLVEVLKQKVDNRAHKAERIIRQIEQGLRSDQETALGIEVEIAAFQAIRDVAVNARANFEQAFETDVLSAVQTLRQVASTPLFREALAWQNRHALRNGVDVFLSKSPAKRSFKQRQREALITSYIQRYSAKNDTIGFFGPVGWAYVAADTGPLLKAEPGPELLAARTTYFEEWCMDVLAETLGNDQALLPWLVPRRMPFVHIEGTILHLPFVPPVSLSPAQAAVLRSCDGERTAHQLATDLLRANIPGLRSVEDVYEILRALLARKRIAWRLEVSIEDLHPEQRLRQCLERVEDEPLRSAGLEKLAALEVGKEAIAHAENAEQLEHAIEHLETIFTNITGMSATRREGKLYAGRSLVYEDCLRDVTVRLGPALADTLGPPLGLLLTSARWFTFEAARLYRTAFKDIYYELCTTTSSQIVPFYHFWLYAHALLFDQHHPLLATLKHNLQERWATILSLPVDQSQVTYHVDSLRLQVEEAFAAPHPGWSSAIYHSPDVMIAASSQEAIRKGEFQYVLGEIHPGANTLQSAFFAAQHPDQHQLLQSVRADRQGVRLVFVPSKELGGATARLSNAFVLPEDWRFVFAHDSCSTPTGRTVPIGSLLITPINDELVVYTRDGHLRWNIMDVLGEFIMLQTLHSFDILPPHRHTPRVTFDRLTICREVRRFEPQECEFASIEREADRFLAARHWMYQHHLPHHTFVKTPTERKPVYVDFDSLLSVDVLARMVRRAMHNKEGHLTFTEMLPDLHECWLQDRQQRHYTSELRMVVVDMGNIGRARKEA